MKTNNHAVEIYQQENRFIAFNSEGDQVFSYYIADPLLRARTVLQWSEEGRFKGLIKE
jgi:hypothetical protein